jgi:glycosyltransferase involved in cell wall biosynthesis
LARHFDITAVIDDHAPVPAADLPYRVCRLHEYRAQASMHDDAHHLYQLGNNSGHVYLLPTLLRRPGLVVLHDPTLHHLVDQATLRLGERDLYARWLERERGDAAAALAKGSAGLLPRERAIFIDLPLTALILRAARGAIVHSAHAERQARADAPTLPVWRLPHHLSPLAEAMSNDSRDTARQQLDEGAAGLLLVTLGFVTPAKRIDRLLQALAQPALQKLPWRLVVAGEAGDQAAALTSQIRRLGLQSRVRLAGYVSDTDFHLWCRAADVVVNLRFPSGGETSGSLVRALGAGACVLVNDIGPFAELPDAVCVKVPISADGHDPGLEEKLLLLLTTPARRDALGRAARRWARQHHGLEQAVRACADAVSALARPPGPLAEAAAPMWWPDPAGHEARLAALSAEHREALPLWAAVGRAPLAQGTDRALLLRTDPIVAVALAHLFGYSSVQIDTRSTAAALAQEAAGWSLVVLDLSTGTAAADAWLQAASNALKPGGCLILSLPAAALPGLHTQLMMLGMQLLHRLTARHAFSPALDLQTPWLHDQRPVCHWLAVATARAQGHQP